MEDKSHLKIWGVIVFMLIIVVFLFGINDAIEPDRMIPQTDMDIVETAAAAGNFSILTAALEAADLIEPLKGRGPFTVFAPTDEAFDKLPEGTLDELLKPESKDQLADILKHHVVREAVFMKGQRLKTLNGDKLLVNDLGTLTVNDAIIVVRDIPASNGLIQVIDAVLIPGEGEAGRTAIKIISSAIELGVPLYNCGNEVACAAVYKSALKDLMVFPENVISSDAKKKISDALDKVAGMDDAGNKAWALRHVLDNISSELKHNSNAVKD